jgi:hypothetical protein
MPSRVNVEEVLEFLGIEDSDLLDQLRREGLFREDQLEGESAEELRVAAALMGDLGVNPAGVEVILHMRRRLIVLEERMRDTVRRLLEELEGD